MKVAFISGPYRGRTINEIAENIQAAEKIAKKYWQMGYAVICPHKNTAFFDGLTDDDIWLRGDLEILSRCDTCIMIDGWKDSEGAKRELKMAQKYGLEVIYD